MNPHSTGFSVSTDDDKYAKKVTPPPAQKVTPPPVVGTAMDHDDKYAKAGGKQGPDAFKKYNNALDLLNFQKVPIEYFFFACFVLLSFAVIAYGFGRTFDVDAIERFGALQLEILGLITLRMKIKEKGSVSGISGMTILMYAVTYFCRLGLSWPASWDFEFKELDYDIMLGWVSLILVLDILKSVFVTHCKTYQAELDVFKAWHLIPCCWTISLLIRPHFSSWTFMYGWCWSSTLYMDVLALMPQVVMMSKAGGKTEAPIANFVAATSISRCGDLFHSLVFLGATRNREPFSYWMAVSVQTIHLLLVADFMYYYMKSKAFTAARLAEEVKLVDV